MNHEPVVNRDDNSARHPGVGLGTMGCCVGWLKRCQEKEWSGLFKPMNRDGLRASQILVNKIGEKKNFSFVETLGGLVHGVLFSLTPILAMLLIVLASPASLFSLISSLVLNVCACVHVKSSAPLIFVIFVIRVRTAFIDRGAERHTERVLG